MPKNRYRFIISPTDSSGQTLSTTEENGRYYFNGIQLFQYSDKDKNGHAPDIFTVTDTQLTLHLKQWQEQVVFQKDTSWQPVGDQNPASLADAKAKAVVILVKAGDMDAAKKIVDGIQDESLKKQVKEMVGKALKQ
jgi:hypothetical protein